MKIPSVNDVKLKHIDKLPVRAWDDVDKRYDSLMVISGFERHGSGWSLIVIVGCIDQKPVEICVACADDINWHFSQDPRMNCAYKSGAMHFWCTEKGKYRVGHALSSTDVWLDPPDDYSMGMTA